MEKTEKTGASLLCSIWPLLFIGAVISLMVIRYTMESKEIGYSPGSGMGLVYGVLAFFLIVVLSGYKVRKTMPHVAAGSLHGWAQSHVYIGIICAFLVFLHSGFQAGSKLSSMLLGLFLLVILSGIVGSLLYRIIPLSISKYGKDITSTNVIYGKFAKVLDDADKHAETVSDSFKELYKKEIRPSLAHTGLRWHYLFLEESHVIDACKARIEDIRDSVSAKELYDLNMMGSIYIEKERLTFKWTKLNSLKIWLYFHVPLTVAMLITALFHVGASFYY